MQKSFVLSSLLLSAAGAQAQNNVLKVDILRPIVQTGAFSFEHKLSESASFQLTFSFTSNYKEDGNIIFNSQYYGGRRTSGFGIMPEYRVYLSDKYTALQGFYAAPFLRYQYLSQSGDVYRFNGPNTRHDASLSAFGGGVLIGRHWIFKRRFSLDLNLGPEYMAASVTSNDPDATQGDFLGFNNFSNYNLNGGITFGIAF